MVGTLSDFSRLGTPNLFHETTPLYVGKDSSRQGTRVREHGRLVAVAPTTANVGRLVGESKVRGNAGSESYPLMTSRMWQRTAVLDSV